MAVVLDDTQVKYLYTPSHSLLLTKINQHKPSSKVYMYAGLLFKIFMYELF